MAAKMIGWGFSSTADDFGTETSKRFLAEHQDWLSQGQVFVDFYAQAGDGDSLILLDACLLALAQRIRDALSKSGVAVQKLPPTVGEQLAKLVQ